MRIRRRRRDEPHESRRHSLHARRLRSRRACDSAVVHVADFVQVTSRFLKQPPGQFARYLALPVSLVRTSARPRHEGRLIPSITPAKFVKNFTKGACAICRAWIKHPVVVCAAAVSWRPTLKANAKDRRQILVFVSAAAGRILHWPSEIGRAHV